MGAPLFPLDAPLVLVVEDDESNRELFVQALTFAGYRVWPQRDAAEAIASAKATPPDLVIVDLVLPGIDGAQLCRMLREDPVTAGTPLLLVTGWPLTEAMRAKLPRKLMSVLMKPFVPDQLLSRSRRLLAAARARRTQDARARSHRLARQTAQQLLKSRRILVVEDDGPMRYVVTKQLSLAGAVVTEASSLAAARAVLQDAGQLDAVVADIVLPDGDAPDVLRYFEQQRKLPVLYITSFPPARCSEYGLNATDPQLLRKPFDGPTLVARVSALCA